MFRLSCLFLSSLQILEIKRMWKAVINYLLWLFHDGLVKKQHLADISISTVFNGFSTIYHITNAWVPISIESLYDFEASRLQNWSWKSRIKINSIFDKGFSLVACTIIDNQAGFSFSAHNFWFHCFIHLLKRRFYSVFFGPTCYI